MQEGESNERDLDRLIGTIFAFVLALPILGISVSLTRRHE
jgi:hypothetical protein